MENLINTNRGSVVPGVLEHISGKNLTIKNTVSKSGLKYGLKRVLLFDS